MQAFDCCNEQLKAPSARALMAKFQVHAACTTDDPCNDLCWHDQIAVDPAMQSKVLPVFHPDKNEFFRFNV